MAWKGSEPYFPLICRRVLNRDMSIPLTFVIFDLLRRDRVDLTSNPYLERREELESLELDGRAWTTGEPFGFEGVVAKNHSSIYRPNDRGWVKVKNPELLAS